MSSAFFNSLIRDFEASMNPTRIHKTYLLKWQDNIISKIENLQRILGTMFDEGILLQYHIIIYHHLCYLQYIHCILIIIVLKPSTQDEISEETALPERCSVDVQQCSCNAVHFCQFLTQKCYSFTVPLGFLNAQTACFHSGIL